VADSLCFHSGAKPGGWTVAAYAVYLLARQGIKPTNGLSSVEQELSHRYPQNWPTDLAAGWLAATYRLMQRDADAERIVAKVPWSRQKRDLGEETYYDPLVHDAQLLYLLARHFRRGWARCRPRCWKIWAAR